MYVTLPWIHCKSSSQTSYRMFDRQKETFSEKIIGITNNFKQIWIKSLSYQVMSILQLDLKIPGGM